MRPPGAQATATGCGRPAARVCTSKPAGTVTAARAGAAVSAIAMSGGSAILARTRTYPPWYTVVVPSRWPATEPCHVVGVDLRLDDWLPAPQVRTRHRTVAHATPDRLWRTAETLSVCQAPMLGRVIRWRIPGTPRDLPYRDLFRCYPFTVLGEGEHSLASGLCGRIWTLQRDYPRLRSAEE